MTIPLSSQFVGCLKASCILQSRKQICLPKKQVEQTQSSVKKLLNPDQLKALGRRSTRGLKWEQETIKKALKLRFACGSTGYELLLQQGQPLPAIRTLQTVLAKIPTPLEFKSNLKLIMAAQYLKVPASASYDVDEGNYLGDLISACARECNTDVVDCVSGDSVEIPGEEKTSLYYVAGYCLQGLLKRKVVCELCFKSATTTDCLEGLSDLTSLKDYKDGALCRVSQSVFNSIEVWETIFRSNKSSTTKNIRKVLIDLCLQSTKMGDILPCHCLPEKLLSAFIDTRLRFSCKALTRKEFGTKSVGSNLSSKSTAMRALVSKV